MEERNQVMHPQLARVAERHRRAWWVLVHSIIERGIGPAQLPRSLIGRSRTHQAGS